MTVEILAGSNVGVRVKPGVWVAVGAVVGVLVGVNTVGEGVKFSSRIGFACWNPEVGIVLV